MSTSERDGWTRVKGMAGPLLSIKPKSAPQKEVNNENKIPTYVGFLLSVGPRLERLHALEGTE